MLELQRKVSEFVRENNLDARFEARYLDLISEIGELAKEHLKNTNYGKNAGTVTESLMLEFGDVMFSFICLANSTGIDLEHALKNALNKYKDRIDKSGTAGSGE